MGLLWFSWFYVKCCYRVIELNVYFIPNDINMYVTFNS